MDAMLAGERRLAGTAGPPRRHEACAVTGRLARTSHREPSCIGAFTESPTRSRRGRPNAYPVPEVPGGHHCCQNRLPRTPAKDGSVSQGFLQDRERAIPVRSEGGVPSVIDEERVASLASRAVGRQDVAH
jgi:hypothetical protein